MLPHLDLTLSIVLLEWGAKQVEHPFLSKGAQAYEWLLSISNVV